MSLSSQATYINYLSITPQRMCVYTRSDLPRIRSHRQIENEENLKNNQTSLTQSAKTMRRIKNALAWLLELSENERFYSIKHRRHYILRVNFITLTLSSKQIHSDNEIKNKLFNQFLTEIRQQWGVKHYVWCCEPQANGNLHFHLTTHKYIPWWEIRKIWNRVQDKLGYTSRFVEKHGHDDPNSIDVHSVRNIKNLPAYLLKYFSKDIDIERPASACAPNNKGVQGKRWGLSYSLSRAKACVLENYCEVSQEFGKIWRRFKNEFVLCDFAQVLYKPFTYFRKMDLKRIVSEFDYHKSVMLGNAVGLSPG